MLCSPRTDTHTNVNTEDTVSGFQDLFLQPIIKDQSKNSVNVDKIFCLLRLHTTQYNTCLNFRSKMGIMESRSIYVYTMCRNTSQSWSSYFKGQVCQSWYMATRASSCKYIIIISSIRMKQSVLVWVLKFVAELVPLFKCSFSRKNNE